MTTFRYVVDLQGIELADPDVLRTWIQYLPLGSYSHPLHGTISITPSRVARFVKNFNDKVRDTDLDIDYEHKMFGSKAAGWITAAEDRGVDGLWVQVEWTPQAWQSLSDKEFRYFSPEFADSWTHPKSGVKFKDVMFGGAITNRPFLKDIQPLSFNEGDTAVNELLKFLRETLQLADEATEEEVQAALTKRLADPPAPKKEADDEADKLKQLAEDNPEIAKVLAENAENRKRIVALEASSRLSDTRRQLSELKTDKTMLPPAVTDKLEGILTQLPVHLSDQVVAALKDLVKTGLVQLKEIGKARTEGDSDMDENAKALSDMHGAIKELMDKDPKLSYADAAMRVASDNPDLANRYYDASTSGGDK